MDQPCVKYNFNYILFFVFFWCCGEGGEKILAISRVFALWEFARASSHLPLYIVLAVYLRVSTYQKHTYIDGKRHSVRVYVDYTRAARKTHGLCIYVVVADFISTAL